MQVGEKRMKIEEPLRGSHSSGDEQYQDAYVSIQVHVSVLETIDLKAALCMEDTPNSQIEYSSPEPSKFFFSFSFLCF